MRVLSSLVLTSTLVDSRVSAGRGSPPQANRPQELSNQRTQNPSTILSIVHAELEKSSDPPHRVRTSAAFLEEQQSKLSSSSSSHAGVEARAGTQNTDDVYRIVSEFAPPKNAIALTQWSALSTSFAELGDKTREVLAVRTDLQNMAHDLGEQLQLWDEAQATLESENLQLEGAVREWEEKVRSSGKWMALNGTLDEDLLSQQALWKDVQADQDSKNAEWDLEMHQMNDRIAKLEALQQKAYEQAQVATQSFVEQERTYEITTRNDTALIATSRMELSGLVSENATVAKEGGDESLMREKYLHMREKLEAEIALLEKETALPETTVASEVEHAQALVQKMKKETADLYRKVKERECYTKGFETVEEASSGSQQENRMTQNPDLLRGVDAERADMNRLMKSIATSRTEQEDYCRTIEDKHEKIVEEIRSRNCQVEIW